MPQPWSPQPIEVYSSWIETIYEQNVQLNTWECAFLLSLSDWIGKNRNLTQKQAEKLEAIYSERTK